MKTLRTLWSTAVPPGLVVPVPGLQGVVHPPAPGRVQPPEVEGLRVLADADVGLRVWEDELAGHVPHTDSGQTGLTVPGLQLSLSGPHLAALPPSSWQKDIKFDILILCHLSPPPSGPSVASYKLSVPAATQTELSNSA